MDGQRRRVRRLHIQLTEQSATMMVPDGLSVSFTITMEAVGLNVSPTITTTDGLNARTDEHVEKG